MFTNGKLLHFVRLAVFFLFINILRIFVRNMDE